MAFWKSVGDFFGRIVDDLFGPAKERPEREIPEPPEPPGGGGGGFFDEPNEQHMRDIWEDITRQPAEFSDFERWEELFKDTGVELIGEPASQIEDWWGDFLRSHYLISEEQGSMSRDDYYEMVGLGRDRIDWEEFREIKRGTP